MVQKHTEVTLNDLLDYDRPETAVIARYQRIMQHRTNEAMNGLSNRLDNVILKLEGVMTTIHRVGQLAQDKADQAIQAAEKAREAQGKQQKAMYILTGVLVGCTLVYTLINGLVALEMKDGNVIQKAIADTAKEQVAATRESNEIQKKLLVQPSNIKTDAKPEKKKKKIGQ